MLANGHQDFTSHVATLLCSGSLVLNVNTSSALLDEEFGKLHDSSKPTVSGVSISDDWTKIISVGHLGAVRGRYTKTFIALFAVVEQLCHK